MAESEHYSIRVLIADGDPSARSLLRSILANDRRIEIAGEAATVSDARRKAIESAPGFIVLDFDLPGGGGLELVRGLPAPRPYLAVLTSPVDFDLQVFDTHADDYLVKPVLPRHVLECASRACQRIIERRFATLAMQIASAATTSSDKRPGAIAPWSRYPQEITIRIRRRMFSVDVRDIVWIQGASQYSRLHAKTGEFLLSRTLASLEVELDPEQFFRVHRSAIINVSYVNEVRSRGDGRYNIHLRGGLALPMGRARRDILGKLLSSLGSHGDAVVLAPPADNAESASADG